MASELKIASALVFDRRWPISSSLASGRPMKVCLSLAMPRPIVVVGALAAAFAVIWPGPVYRKYGEWWRSTRTRLSPGLRPLIGRRPPITGGCPTAHRTAAR